MHDRNLRRTTNIEDVAPLVKSRNPSLFPWEFLKLLNAGEWFVLVGIFRTRVFLRPSQPSSVLQKVELWNRFPREAMHMLIHKIRYPLVHQKPISPSDRCISVLCCMQKETKGSCCCIYPHLHPQPLVFVCCHSFNLLNSWNVHKYSITSQQLNQSLKNPWLKLQLHQPIGCVCISCIFQSRFSKGK